MFVNVATAEILSFMGGGGRGLVGPPAPHWQPFLHSLGVFGFADLFRHIVRLLSQLIGPAQVGPRLGRRQHRRPECLVVPGRGACGRAGRCDVLVRSSAMAGLHATVNQSLIQPASKPGPAGQFFWGFFWFLFGALASVAHPSS